MTREESTVLQQLCDRVEQLGETIHDHRLTVERHIEACKPCRHDVAELKLTMYGEGAAPGIKGAVNQIQQDLRKRDQEADDHRNRLRWGLGLLWSALVGLGAAVLKIWWGK